MVLDKKKVALIAIIAAFSVLIGAFVNQFFYKARIEVICDGTPKVLRDDECYASILSTENNQHYEYTMDLSEDSSIRIVYQGEGANSDMAPSLVETFQNDCIEFFIDTKGTDRQYRFVWGSDIISGKNLITKGVRFAQGDSSDNHYCFELEFPWSSLEIHRPADTDTIIMDCSVIDNDAESRKTQIAWHCDVEEIYEGSRRHGKMPLKGLRTSTAPSIDGIKEPLWDKYPSFSMENEIIGGVRDSSDLAGSFYVIWDDTALYAFVDVIDDIKKQAEILFDRAEIRDEEDNLVWRSLLGRTSHAGGALKNRRQDDILYLTAGKYTLHYTTDESHSAGHWDDVPPTEPFSGLKVYLLGK